MTAEWLYPNGTTREPKIGPLGMFGPRKPLKTPAGTTGSFHTGVDYVGFPTVYAIGPGVVIYAAYNTDYGNEIRVQHDGFVSRYAHLAGFSIGVGRRVGAGVRLGPMGDTGKALGVHLHLRFDVHGVAFDPRPTLARLVSSGGSGGSTPTRKRIPMKFGIIKGLGSDTVYAVRLVDGAARPITAAEYAAFVSSGHILQAIGDAELAALLKAAPPWFVAGSNPLAPANLG